VNLTTAWEGSYCRLAHWYSTAQATSGERGAISLEVLKPPLPIVNHPIEMADNSLAHDRSVLFWAINRQLWKELDRLSKQSPPSIRGDLLA